MSKRSDFVGGRLVLSRLGYFVLGFMLFALLSVVLGFVYTGFSVDEFGISPILEKSGEVNASLGKLGIPVEEGSPDERHSGDSEDEAVGEDVKNENVSNTVSEATEGEEFRTGNFGIQSGSCVNLSDSSTFGSKVVAVSATHPTWGVYNISYINQNTTLCESSYTSSFGTLAQINASNIVFDCNSSVLTSNDYNDDYAYGINITTENITITNCTINDFKTAIYGVGVNHSVFRNNTVSSLGTYGIYLVLSNYNVFYSNTNGMGFEMYNLTYSNFTNNSLSGVCINFFGSRYNLVEGNSLTQTAGECINGGVMLEMSNDTNIINNTITSSTYYGISLVGDSNSNNISYNSFNGNNNYDIYVFPNGSSSLRLCDNVIENNTGAGGWAIRYYNRSVKVSDIELSEAVFCNADYSNATNLTFVTGTNPFRATNNGLLAVYSDHMNISHSNLTLADDGVRLHKSHYNNINNNIFKSNTLAGVYIWLSDNTTLKENIINSNTGRGIYSIDSNYTTIVNNSISSNTLDGLYFQTSNHITINNNTINSNSGYGAYLNNVDNSTIANTTFKGNRIEFKTDCNYNKIIDSTISNNTSYAILLDITSSTETHDNQFKNLTISASADYAIYLKAWTSYYPQNNIFEDVKIYNSTKYIYMDASSSQTNNFTNLTLCYNETVGCINWRSSLSITNASLVNGTSILLMPDFISMDSGLAGASQFAGPVNLSLASENCSSTYYFTIAGFPKTRNSILGGTQFLPVYSSCVDGITTFSVSNLSGYSVNSTPSCVNLSDQTTYLGKVVNVSAVYYIVKNTTLCSGAYSTGYQTNFVIVNTSNITLDCNGAVLNGQGLGQGNDDFIGIDIPEYTGLFKVENSTLKNCIVGNFSIGIRAGGNLYNTFTNNTIIANTGRAGLYVTTATSNFTHNNIVNNSRGIEILSGENNNYFINNTVSGNLNGGIYCAATSNVFINNTIQDNWVEDFSVYFTTGSCNLNLVNNIGSGGYYINYTNNSVNWRNFIASEVILCNADYSNLTNITLIGSGILKNNGLVMLLTDYANVTLSNASSAGRGFYLRFSTNNTFISNIANHNNLSGFYVWDSSNNSFINNTANNNDRMGFEVLFSGVDIAGNANNNLFTNNTAKSNNISGFGLSRSNMNVFINNTAYNNSIYGFNMWNSNNGTFTNSTILGNGYGFRISSSSGVSITNAFIKGSNNQAGILIEGGSVNTTFSDSLISNLSRALFANFSSNVSIIRSNISSNKLGLVFSNTIDVNLSKCEILNNSAAGVVFFNSSGYVVNNSFVNNSGSSLRGSDLYGIDRAFENSTFSGGGITLVFNGSVNIWNNTFCNNSLYGVYISDTLTDSRLINNTNSFCLGGTARISEGKLFQVRVWFRGGNYSGANVTLFRGDNLTKVLFSEVSNWEGLSSIMPAETYVINNSGDVSLNESSYQIRANTSRLYSASKVQEINESRMYWTYNNEYWFNAYGPSISISCPSSAYNDESVNIGCSATDDLGVEGVSVSLDGTSFCSGKASCSAVYKPKEGNRDFVCYASDVEGNTGSTMCKLMVNSITGIEKPGIKEGGEEKIKETTVHKREGGGVRIISENTQFDVYYEDNKPVLDISFLKLKPLGEYEVVNYASPKSYVSAFLLGGILLCCAFLFGKSIVSGVDAIMNAGKPKFKKKS